MREGEDREGVVRVKRRPNRESKSGERPNEHPVEGSHFRKAERRGPIGSNMMAAVDELIKKGKKHEIPREERDIFITTVEDHLGSGQEIKDEKIKELWRGFVKAHRVDSEAGLLKAYKSQGSEVKGAFNKNLAQNFWDWVLREREIAGQPVEPVKPAPTKVETPQTVGKPEEQKHKTFLISLNRKKLEKFTDDSGRNKVLAFVETCKSGRVRRVEFTIDNGQNPPAITEMEVIALRQQRGKMIEDRQKLSRELLTSVFENIFPFQRKEKGAASGPVVGIGLLYAPKSFQSIQPDHPEMWKEILGRWRMDGVGLADNIGFENLKVEPAKK